MMCGSLTTTTAPHKDDDRPCWVTLESAGAVRPQRELLPLSLVRALQAAGHTPDDLRGLTLEQAKRLLKPE